MTEEKREDLRREEALVERAVTALVAISDTLDKMLRTQTEEQCMKRMMMESVGTCLLKMIQRIG